MTSARRLYRLHLALALLAGSGLLAGVLFALSRIRPGVPTVDELLAACRKVIPFESGPGSLLVALFALAGLAVVMLGVGSLSRQLREQRRFMRTVRRIERKTIDGVEVTIVEAAAPKAFCVGLLRPRVYLSTGALALLAPVELAAVVAHEAHHKSRRDPLRILAASVLADALFFLPALSRLSDRYRRLAELAADEAAAKLEGRSALASALVRFGERGGEPGPTVGIAPERVEQLLGEPPRWQLSIPVLSGSLVTLVALIGLVLAAPSLVSSQSVSFPTVLAEGCMALMLAAPVAIGASAAWLSRTWIRGRLEPR